jgi:hypothetical protein
MAPSLSVRSLAPLRHKDGSARKAAAPDVALSLNRIFDLGGAWPRRLAPFLGVRPTIGWSPSTLMAWGSILLGDLEACAHRGHDGCHFFWTFGRAACSSALAAPLTTRGGVCARAHNAHNPEPGIKQRMFCRGSTVRVGTTEALSAFEGIKPRLKRVVGQPPVVTGERRGGQ